MENQGTLFFTVKETNTMLMSNAKAEDSGIGLTNVKKARFIICPGNHHLSFMQTNE